MYILVCVLDLALSFDLRSSLGRVVGVEARSFRRDGVPGREDGLWARFPSSASRSCSVEDFPELDFGARVVVGLVGRGLV